MLRIPAFGVSLLMAKWYLKYSLADSGSARVLCLHARACHTGKWEGVLGVGVYDCV